MKEKENIFLIQEIFNINNFSKTSEIVKCEDKEIEKFVKILIRKKKRTK